MKGSVSDVLAPHLNLQWQQIRAQAVAVSMGPPFPPAGGGSPPIFPPTGVGGHSRGHAARLGLVRADSEVASRRHWQRRDAGFERLSGGWVPVLLLVKSWAARPPMKGFSSVEDSRREEALKSRLNQQQRPILSPCVCTFWYSSGMSVDAVIRCHSRVGLWLSRMGCIHQTSLCHSEFSRVLVGNAWSPSEHRQIPSTRPRARAHAFARRLMRRCLCVHFRAPCILCARRPRRCPSRGCCTARRYANASFSRLEPRFEMGPDRNVDTRPL